MDPAEVTTCTQGSIGKTVVQAASTWLPVPCEEFTGAALSAKLQGVVDAYETVIVDPGPSFGAWERDK